MFIRRMEIFGFKSFKNKTVLEFANQEITGIVGPNGCGKSNVVEAFLWVMGESSPKNLRSESLSDVIFSGTTKEEPGNIVEVNMILGSGHSGFPIAYKTFSEVMITRKAYRNGQNEYFINNQLKTLKEVREFFMNTGVGRKGFSIIEQESIEKLITAKPKQRRFIIEEVAGITKFKSRKEEAERKFNLVKQNLQRLDDVLKIQQAQLNQLTQQAKQAKKYQELKKDIEIRKLEIEKQVKEEAFQNYQELITKQKTLENESLAKKEKLVSLEKLIETAKVNINEIKKENLIQKVQLEKLRILKSTQEKRESLIESIKIKRESLIESIKVKKKALKEKETEIKKELSPIYDFFQKGFSQSESELEADKIKKHLEEIKHSRKEIEFKIDFSKKEIQIISKSLKQIFEENKELTLQIQKQMKEKNKIYSSLEKQKQMSLKFDKELHNVLENKSLLETKKMKLESIESELSKNISVIECKIEEMKKLISQFESINEGARDLIQWKPKEFQSLFQNLKVESEYISALESVLGSHVQAVIPNEKFSIHQAVDRLKKTDRGRTSFLVSLPTEKESLILRDKLKTYPAVLCFLDEKVTLTFYTEPLKILLSKTVVVSDLQSAFELKTQFPKFQFVTKEGDFVTKEAFVYAGSNKKEASLFAIRDQIEHLCKDLSSQKIKQKVNKLELESCMKQWNQIQKQKKDIQSQNKDHSDKIIFFEKDLEHLEKELIRLLAIRTKNEEKISGYNDEKKNLLKYEKAYNQEIKVFDDIISVKEMRLKSLSSSLEDYKAYSIKKLRWEKELSDNQKDQKNLEKERELLSNMVNQLQLVGQEDKANLDISQTFLTLEEELEHLKKKKKSLIVELEECEHNTNQQDQIQAQKEKTLSDLEKEIIEAQMNLKDIDFAIEKNIFEQENLKKKFRELYKLEVENFVSSDTVLEKSKLDTLYKEVELYEKKLNSFSGINFLALDEYEKLSKENLFLNSQKEDLVNSKKEIVKVISHIDKLCTSRFKDMLEEINKRFSKVFPIIFQGDNAKAELILIEEGEELGVDILIQPPGKHPQSITLLSRGEKALTSICLIYSLFLVKPSPFCIIDEADAPLDDANVFRFISVLKEMAEKSQIILITHNKYTMQTCKKLYGVTMNRPGVSQIVSVDMDAKKSILKSLSN